MLPNTLIITHFTARGMRLWVGARLLAGAVVALGGGDPVHLTLSTVVLLVATCIALGLADVHRRHERALLENLGVSRFERTAFFAFPAIIGEGAIALFGSIVG